MRLAHLSLAALSAVTSISLGLVACMAGDDDLDDEYPVLPGVGTSTSRPTGGAPGDDSGGIAGPSGGDGGMLFDGTGSLDGGTGLPDTETGTLEDAAP